MKKKLSELQVKRLGLVIIAFLLSFNMYSQTINGIVTSAEDGLPLPGVNIVLKGGTTNTMTDLNGKYTITVNSPQDVLVFTFIGMQTYETPVGNQATLNVAMKPSEQTVDEVVVVGYGKLKVKDLTASISTIKSDEIASVPSGQAMQSLQGKVAGLQVVGSGGPGNSPVIRLRGIGSFPGSGNESPLYVVDGMFFNNIDFLNPSEIASISVLKDASASAIYGIRAANGVVLIETKSGNYNQKAKISYDGYYGVQIAQNVLKMANSEQFATMANESGSAADQLYILNAMQRFGRSRINPNVPDVNTDWYKEILRNAPIQNHSLTVEGGGQNATYSIGTSYFYQEGILNMKNDYERFNLRSKIDYKAKEWFTIGANMTFSNGLRHGEQGSAWNDAYFAVPVMPVYDEFNTTAKPTNFSSAELLGYRGGKNPLPAMTFNQNRLKIMKLLTSFYTNLDLIPKKLSFKTTYSFASSLLNERNLGFPFLISQNFQRVESHISKVSSTYTNQTWDNILTYSDAFGKHDLTLMVGSSYKIDAGESLFASANNFPTENEENWYIAQTVPEDINILGVGDGGFKEYGLSYFGRVSYNFNNKYLIYGTLRADGTSKYQEKWGYFPTFGVGWVASEENFMESLSMVDYLKLRASWGKLGNANVGASDGAITTYTVSTALKDQLYSGTITRSLFSWLGWEVIDVTNVGITSKFFKNRLSLDADYYIRDTKNAVIIVTYPFGLGSIRKNVGQIRNSGFEFILDWSDKAGDFTYNIGANLSTLKNEVKDLYGQLYIDGGSAEFRQRSYVGEPLGAFYGYQITGVYQNTAQVQADPIAVANSLVPGDFIYKDQNGDGKIDGEDRVILGSYFPTLMYGGNIGLGWKNFELAVSFVGQLGNKILNRKRGELIWTNDGNIDADLAVNRWHGEGTSNVYPSSAGLRKGWNQKMSTFYVEDGSFFRIQNAQLAYNLKNAELMGVKLPDMRISFTAARPLTVFKYNGFNPEIANGIDTQTYPIPAVYTFGLNINL
jgi:TonB-dependent starch-binding outer membrane protein SusC